MYNIDKINDQKMQTQKQKKTERKDKIICQVVRLSVKSKHFFCEKLNGWP